MTEAMEGAVTTSVLWHVFMSVDGFIARPGDDMRWVFDYGGPNDAVEEVVRTTGALVVGRRTYEVEDRDRQGFYGGGWQGPFFVVTHVPPRDRPEWMTGTFVTDGVASAVRQAKAAAGGKNVVVLGADMARQATESGLLDEILISLTPVLLGDGVRLFSRRDGVPIKLEKLAVSGAGPVTNMRYAVRTPAAGR